jgi:hypothetical protein
MYWSPGQQLHGSAEHKWLHAGALTRQEGVHASAALLAQLPAVLLECVMDCLAGRERQDMAEALAALPRGQEPLRKSLHRRQTPPCSSVFTSPACMHACMACAACTAVNEEDSKGHRMCR